jgi:hypothetical protein
LPHVGPIVLRCDKTDRALLLFRFVDGDANGGNFSNEVAAIYLDYTIERIFFLIYRKKRPVIPQ